MANINFGNEWDYLESGERLKEKINDIKYDEILSDFSSIIELYKLKSWINPANFRFPEVQETLKLFPELKKNLKALVGKSLANKSPDVWIGDYQNSDEDAPSKLVHLLFSEFCYWTKLSNEAFKNYLWSEKSILSYLLLDKKIVDKYSDIIVDNLINDETHIFNNVQLIESLVEEKATIYFPNGFEGSDGFQTMVNKLIDILDASNFRDVAFIQPLQNFQLSKFPLNEETRNRVDSYVKKYWEQIETKQKIISPAIRHQVTIDSKQENPIEMTANGRSFHAKLSKKWLDSIEEDDFIFVSLINFVVDDYNRPLSISCIKKNKASLTDIVISNNYRGPRMYRDDFITMMRDEELTVILYSLSDYLTSKNLSFEKLIARYFNRSILQNHNISGFSMEEIDGGISIDIKIKLLAIELESILKQFELLVKYDSIDLNYLQYMTPLDIDTLGSLIPNKYVEISQEEILESKEALIKDVQFIFETHNYFRADSFTDLAIEKMRTLKSFKFTEKLFSSDEADFLSYCLNNKKYNNAIAVRNKYLHGSTKHLSEQEHERNYIAVIKVFLIVIAKIEEELYYKTKCSN